MRARWLRPRAITAALVKGQASWGQANPAPKSACQAMVAQALWRCPRLEATSPAWAEPVAEPASAGAPGRAADYPEKAPAQQKLMQPKMAQAADLKPWRAAESRRIPAPAARATEPLGNRRCPESPSTAAAILSRSQASAPTEPDPIS